MKLYNNNTTDQIEDIKFNFGITNDFKDILYFSYPKDIYKKIKEDKYHYLILLLIDKYEFITFKNITRYGLEIEKNKSLNLLENNNKYDFLNIKNNIFSIFNFELLPLTKFYYYNNNVISNKNSMSFKYFSVYINNYFRMQTNKKIVILKLIGPNEIDSNNNLKLYFYEENVLNDNENETFTIFLYLSWGIDKLYTKVINEQYDYIIIHNINELMENKIIKRKSKTADILYITSFLTIKLTRCSIEIQNTIHQLYFFNYFCKYFKPLHI
jgi:hypothetical protein